MAEIPNPGVDTAHRMIALYNAQDSDGYVARMTGACEASYRGDRYDRFMVRVAEIRPTAFSHLQAMDFMCKGHMLADTTAILGAIDVVFGECDR